MSGVLNVATKALLANQTLLQTTGHNIANVNTPGYSRQSGVLHTTPGQVTGGGYVGKGVDIVDIARTYNEFLTRQSAMAGSISAGDATRAEKMRMLEDIFPSGESALGAAVSDMLNAFADVAGAPTDLTARTVALTRVNEAASRMRSVSQSLDDLQLRVSQEISQKVDTANSIAQSIATVNRQISDARGNGQTANDLLDQRDQLLRELGEYVQATTIENDDGTMSVFIGGGQTLVYGSTVSTLSAGSDDFADPTKSKLSIHRGDQEQMLDENLLGGGQISGLIRFQNNDLNEGRNLMGRLTLAVSTSMNDQHRLGLDLDGNKGGDLFTPTVYGPRNILTPQPPAVPNKGDAVLGMAVYDVTKFSGSDYEIVFTGDHSGTIKRSMDGVTTAFDLASGPLIIDGLKVTLDSGTAQVSDRFLLKPFSTSASNIHAEFSTPRALAVASPVAGEMGQANQGSLQLSRLVARTNPPTNIPVTLTFQGDGTYTRSDVAGTFAFTSGQSIEGAVPTVFPLSQWSVVLQGEPQAGDTYTILAQPAAFRNLDAGNAQALMDLRDVAMFDGSALTDGYAGIIAQVGIRAQSANYAADVSGQISENLETDRTGVSGVNLDEEASKLIQFQQAYQASAKVIQVAQGIFDALIQAVAR
ncbi:flagellar hook-associated protein FlgK [Candidatus Symbiobacter mobilis]|uniref:Flagellar hook-associated protein 1 n=1 Tax=Candidatus Symbiobacter mobilis CR TaxID=946483 RepID=U5NB73_9BURK|nr:flagellar hook-associated protein FlgK [Candidatus Symbiobacter mobilis]AGX87414.1 flagellar hook-associated protein 1 [Candidatus Symbiobacter mobilis CR]